MTRLLVCLVFLLFGKIWEKFAYIDQAGSFSQYFVIIFIYFFWLNNLSRGRRQSAGMDFTLEVSQLNRLAMNLQYCSPATAMNNRESPLLKIYLLPISFRGLLKDG